MDTDTTTFGATLTRLHPNDLATLTAAIVWAVEQPAEEEEATLRIIEALIAERTKPPGSGDDTSSA